LSQIAIEYTFEQGAIVAYQRDLADSMIIVMEGRLFSREIDSQGRVREENTRDYTPEGYFGEKCLFAPEIQPATVEATHSGRYIEIPGEDFRIFLANRPPVLSRLEPVFNAESQLISGLPKSAWELAQQLVVEDSGSDESSTSSERLIFQTRQSRLHLLWQLILPGIFLLFAAFFLLISLTQIGGFQPGTFWNIFAFIVILICTAVILYEVYDWYKDVLRVTDQYITLDEFDFGSFTTIMIKVPIHQVQTVSILKPSIIANILKLGGIGITTASNVGEIRFNYIRNPIAVMEIITAAVREAQSAEEAATLSDMRSAISSYFNIESGTQPVDNGSQPTADIPIKRRRNLWPFRFRIVEGDTITYRRNISVLIGSLGKPILLTISIAVAGIIIGSLFGSGSWLMYTLFTIAIIINIIWYIYEFIDWKNDIFQVNDRLVIDEDRSPFLSRVSRKQAPLSNVQNVRVNKKGIIATVFNFGDVHIETAGATSDIVFENIHNPRQALYDIFFRLDKLRDSERQEGGELRRKEYNYLLDVYQQETERERIPRRLPEIDD
jgi:uncharacterized membrane protein YdbT with pleckstrin-like domain